MSENIRVRFAPSPTGYLHVGGARTAIYNWLFARANQGTFILRIEDTDRKRYNEQALEDLLEDLKWLGLDWDEGTGAGGDFGPYQQSERLAIYQQSADTLVEKGLAYHCFCTAERLDQLRAEQNANKSAQSGYDGHCRNLTAEEVQSRLNAGEKSVIRLKTPDEGVTAFEDLLRGRIEYKNEVLDDLVLLKRDGYPTYHLASVIDDHAMQISHVLRGDEWIASTPKHVQIYEAFGWDMPVFCHLPVILAAGGGKLSKRKGATSVGEYRKMGYLSDTMVNFLSLLGWSPGDDREVMSREELISAFTLERINSSGVAFDEKKLLWMNGQHMQHVPSGELLEPLKSQLQELGVDVSAFGDDYVLRCLQMMQSRVKLVSDLGESCVYFFQDPKEYDEKAQRKQWKEDTPALVNDLIGSLESLQEWNQPQLEQVYQTLCEQKEIGLGKLIHPSRLAVSGVSAGPGLYELLEVLGKETVIQRLQKANEVLNP